MLVDYNPARWSSSPATASSLRAAWHKRDSIHARTNTTNRGPFKSIRLLFNKLRFFKRKKNHQPPIRTLRVPRREKKPKRREILPAGSLAVNIPVPPAEFIKEIGASVLVERLKGHGKKTFRIKAIETVTAAYQSATKGLLPTIQGPLERDATPGVNLFILRPSRLGSTFDSRFVAYGPTGSNYDASA